MKVGLVGCGALANSQYVRTLPAAGITVDMVHDVNGAAAERTARLFGATAVDFATLQREADAVLIATPPSTHVEIIRRLLRRDRLLLCEKPFVGTGAEAASLVEEARRAGAVLYVGHLRRTFPAVRVARDLVGSGALGDVVAFDVAEGGRFSWAAASGYTSRDPYGGVLYDTGSHALDMALFIAGLDTVVEAACQPTEVRRDRDEPAHAIRAAGHLIARGRKVAWALRLSRFGVLANRVVVRCRHGSLAVSVSPGGGLRLWGPLATHPLPITAVDFETSFVRQWRDVFSRRADYLRADRFIALSAMLEAIALAGEAVPWDE